MNYTFRKAAAILFSRIVLTHLDNEQRREFRKAEKLTKQYTKIKSDLKYLKLETAKIAIRGCSVVQQVHVLSLLMVLELKGTCSLPTPGLCQPLSSTGPQTSL